MQQRTAPDPRYRRPTGPPLVLIVDDDPAVREICSLALVAAGYRTSTAASADEATRLLTEGEVPALVILDLMMPGTDGFAAMHALRSERRTSTVPILVLTGLSNNVEEATRRLGATAFFSKPLEPKRLVAKVRSLCPLPPAAAGPRPPATPSYRS